MKKRFCFGLMAASMVFASPPLYAQSPAEALAKIQRSKDPKVIFEAAFKGRFFSARTKKERFSLGEVAYSAPTSFRWEVQSPEPEIYTSSGTALWKFNPRAKHAQQIPMNEAGLDFLKALLDPADLTKRYSIEEWSAKEKNSALEKSFSDFDTLPTQGAKAAASSAKVFARLVPKSEGNPEEYLYLIADSKSGQIDEIRIAFRNGNRNIITFEKWGLSKAGPEIFKFEPPAGTAIDKM